MLHTVVGSTRSLTFWAPIHSGLYASLLTECAGLQMSMGNNLLSGTISTGGCISPLCVSPPLHLPNQEPSFIDNPDPGKCLMLPCHSESSNALVLNHTSPAFLFESTFPNRLRLLQVAGATAYGSVVEGHCRFDWCSQCGSKCFMA